MQNKIAMALVCLALLAGCASSDTTPEIDTSLYAGKPIESLSNSEPPKTEQEALARGDLALRNNDVDLALYEYLRSLTFPNAQFKDKTLFTVGQIHLNAPNLELAERAFKASLSQNPNNIGALEELGALYSRSGRTEEGMSYFIKALNADQLRLEAKPEITADNLTKEMADNIGFDRSSPDKAYNGLGVLYDVKGQHDLAQALFKNAMNIDSTNINALINLGYSYYMTEDYNKAMIYTNAALKRDESNEKALNNLALVYMAQGNTRQALNVFKRHLSEPEALNNVGYFLILQGKAEQAIPYLQQAIDKNPSYYDVANQNLERALSMVREGSNSSIVLQ